MAVTCTRELPDGLILLPRCSLRQQVVHLEACGGFTEAEVLSVAGAAERGASHPLAAALVGAAAGAGADTGAPVTDSRSLQGQARALGLQLLTNSGTSRVFQDCSFCPAEGPPAIVLRILPAAADPELAGFGHQKRKYWGGPQTTGLSIETS